MLFPFSRYLACTSAIFIVSVALAAASTAVRVPGTKVSLAPPADFVASERFPGFQHNASGSSIMVTEMPAPISQTKPGMTKEGLAKRGMTLELSEDKKIAGRDALFLTIKQTGNGISFRKWLAVFGTEKETILIAATCPDVHVEEFGEKLKQSILGATWREDSKVGMFDGLTFRIVEQPGLKFASRVSNMLMFNKDGSRSPSATGDPLLIVGSSVGDSPDGKVEDLSKDRIQHISGISEIAITDGKTVTIGEREAYELVANGKDTASGTPMLVYQFMLIKGSTYYIVQGIVGTKDAETYVPEFRNAARSLTFIDDKRVP